MNRQAAETMIAYLEKLPEEKFDMSAWWCDTAGCIAGHVLHVLGNDDDRAKVRSVDDVERVVFQDGSISSEFSPKHRAAELMGMSIEDATSLFVPSGVTRCGWVTSDDPYHATPAQAAAELRARLKKQGGQDER
jgi:hypothetical protein